MKKAFSFFLLFTALGCFAQTEKDMSMALSTKQFAAFNAYCDKLLDKNNQKKGQNNTSYWVYLRDVATGYREGIFMLTYYTKGGVEHTLRVNVITGDSLIAYYDFMRLVNRDKSEGGKYYDTIERYMDTASFKDMAKSFRKSFGVPLARKELFLDSIVYGHGCGFTGSAPGDAKKIDAWVAAQDTVHLQKWLQSPNTEKQLFAIEGYNKLKKKGYIPSQKILGIIQFVKYKKGTALSCSGCVYDNSTISTITVGFDF